MSRPLTISAALAMLLGVAVVTAAPAAAQTPAVSRTADGCGPFRVEWNRGVLSPTAEKLEGFVYNDSTCSVTDVRLRVVAVDGDGHPIAETLGWVFGDIAPGARGYFALSLTSTPAAGYRVDVAAFDEISPADR
jgi:hypothetical protein